MHWIAYHLDLELEWEELLKKSLVLKNVIWHYAYMKVYQHNWIKTLIYAWNKAWGPLKFDEKGTFENLRSRAKSEKHAYVSGAGAFDDSSSHTSSQNKTLFKCTLQFGLF